MAHKSCPHLVTHVLPGTFGTCQERRCYRKVWRCTTPNCNALTTQPDKNGWLNNFCADCLRFCNQSPVEDVFVTESGIRLLDPIDENMEDSSIETSSDCATTASNTDIGELKKNTSRIHEMDDDDSECGFSSDDDFDDDDNDSEYQPDASEMSELDDWHSNVRTRRSK